MHEPISVDGTTVTTTIDPDQLGASLGPGAAVGAVDVQVSTADEATGRDHVVGEGLCDDDEAPCTTP